jgi:flagellar capping protein FliD
MSLQTILHSDTCVLRGKIMLGSITFGSLMSGIDTDSIVSALVNARRFQITQLEDRAENLNFYKSVLRKVNTQLLGLQKASLNLRLESTFKNKIASFSHENYIAAAVGFNAVPRSYIMEVNNLARGASATSGLNSRAYERGAAALIRNNTAGVSTVEVTETNLSGMRASMNSILTETLQAGKGVNEVTAGDQITITGTRKSGAAVNATFTFNGDATDTLQRFANTIASAFQGDVNVVLDSNGALTLVEKDTGVAGNFTLTGLTFVDADYSGSTLSIDVGTSIASGGTQAQVLTGTRTFTTGDSANIATAATTLDSLLDQITGGDLDGADDQIHITGTDHDGNDIDAWYTYNLGDTFQELLDTIETAYGSTVTATMENGKIVLTDTTTGESELSLNLEFDDAGATTNDFSLGIFLTTTTGADSTQQIIKTTKFETPAEGKYFLNFTQGKGGQLTGTVSVTEDTILGNIGGITNYNLFTIDRDTGSGQTAPTTILGLNERSSVRDLIEAINTQVPDVTAGLVDDGAGGYYLQVTSNRGGEEVRITDGAGGLLENIFNPTGGVDTDYTTSNSTSDADDFTVTAQFTTNISSSPRRFIVTGDEGNAIDGLIGNISIEGGDTNEFDEGIAIFYTNESSELNVIPATHTHIIGANGISSSYTTPRLNVLATLAEAGFATIPENEEDNEDFHTDGFFTINGVRIEIDDVDRMTVNELIGAINSSGAGVIANYDSATDRFTLQATQTGEQSITLGGGGDTSNFLTIAGLNENGNGVLQAGNEKGKINTDALIAYAGFTFIPGSGTFTINGVKIYIDQSKDTLKTVIQKINNSGAGVVAVYDENTDRLTLSQDLTKEVFFNQITIGDATDTSAFLAAVRLTDTPSASTTIGTQREQAEVMLDGTTYFRDSNNIDDLIADTTLDLKSVTTNPINLDISVDTDRSIQYLAEFVSEYNKFMALINIQPLSDDERENMAPLADADYDKMTYTQIEEYETNRQSYRERDLIFKDSTLSRLNWNIRSTVFNPVKSMTGEINALADLNITSGIINAGLAESQTPYLVEDTTDVETIVQKLQEDPELVQTLREDFEDLYSLFSNEQESSIEVKGSYDILYGITVTNKLSFQIGTGGTNATVNFDPGSYTYAQVLNTIQQSLANSDLADDIYVGLDSDNKIVLRNTVESGKASLYVFDLNAGDSLDNILGLESGIYRGETAEESGGLSIRLDNYIQSYTGIGGILQSRITTGGQIDREIGYLADQMDIYQDRLDQYEERLRRQFIAMETAMSQFQQTSQFLASRMAASSNQNNQSGMSLS